MSVTCPTQRRTGAPRLRASSMLKLGNLDLRTPSLKELLFFYLFIFFCLLFSFIHENIIGLLGKHTLCFGQGFWCPPGVVLFPHIPAPKFVTHWSLCWAIDSALGLLFPPLLNTSKTITSIANPALGEKNLFKGILF